MDYISPTGDLNYEAIDGLAKALYDRYKEAEFEQIVELFKKYIGEQTWPKGQQYFIDKFVKERGANLMISKVVWVTKDTVYDNR